VKRVEQVLFAIALAGLMASCRRSSNSPTAPRSNSASPWFEDITSKSGLNFVHDSGATGSYFMPESIGSGAALFDFDNDGRLDIYLVHCVGPGSKSRNRLYHQEPDGHFRDVSDGSGLDVTGYGMGVAVGDVNNDGLPDVLLTEYGRARLFMNRGAGKFEDVTASAGIDNSRWATSAAFFDYDRDGWLDLVIANYVDYNPTQKCPDVRGQLEYCGPENMGGTVTKLFRNLGPASTNAAQRLNVSTVQRFNDSTVEQFSDSTSGARVRFEDVSVSSGLAQKPGPALGVLCADFDGDGWPDIFLADDGQPNRLFINLRNGAFVEEAALHGIAYNALGGAAANMGVAPGDVNGDGLLDLLVTHLMWEQPALWKQGPRGLFQDSAAAMGLANVGWRGTGFGAVIADFDQDGAPDLALVNGSIKRGNDPAPRLEGLAPFWWPYAQRNQIFANDGHDTFHDISTSNPDFCGQAGVGRGLACGDLDNDGALDLLAICAGGPVRIFRNVAPNRGHWLMIRAVDPLHGGRDAYGAEITVEAGGRHWWRLVQPGYSYLVNNDPRAHFGLGPIATVDRIHILWPDGTDENFAGGASDRLVIVRKGTGSAVSFISRGVKP
jgi:hypothetical protein